MRLVLASRKHNAPTWPIPPLGRSALITASGSTRIGVSGLARAREEAVLRPRQAEIFAQRATFVFAAEQSPALQLGHNAIDEILKSTGQIWKHYIETIRALAQQPLLHLVRNGRGGANEGKTAVAAEALRELAH